MSDPAHLFVYGTLRPGRAAWSVLAPFVTDNGVDHTVPGTLYDTGDGYPAARFDPVSCTRTVHGTLVALDAERHAAALHHLDRYEGPGYRRITVSAGALEAFTYEWIGPTAGLHVIADGIWPTT